MMQLSPKNGGKDVVLKILRRSSFGTSSQQVLQCCFDKCQPPSGDRTAYWRQVNQCGVNRKRFSGGNWWYCSHDIEQMMTCPYRVRDFRPSPGLVFRTKKREKRLEWSRDVRTQNVLTFTFSELLALCDAPGKVGIAAKAWVSGDWSEADNAFANGRAVEDGIEYRSARIAAQHLVAETIARKFAEWAAINQLRPSRHIRAERGRR
jgi:hypothetical protein